MRRGGGFAQYKIVTGPTFFKQNLEPKKLRGKTMGAQVQTKPVGVQVNEVLDRANARRGKRLATNAAFSLVVFPFALWIMLGLGVVHSHFGVVPAIGYWETTLILLATNAAVTTVALGVGRSDG